MNLKKIIELKKENEQLKEMVKQAHENFEKAYKLLNFYKARCELLETAVTGGNIDFPNSNERGSADADTAANLSDIFES